jgi:rRNA biogenesis protein RRP5
VLEGLLANMPKRVDLWSLFIDMELKQATLLKFSEPSKAIVRRLFERVVHLDLRARKMKFFFKRYLLFEKEHGSSSTVHHVKELAQKYVSKQTA